MSNMMPTTTTMSATTLSTSNIPNFKHITVTPLHPTFGAEVRGIDFSKEVDEDVFAEVLHAITVACPSHLPFNIGTDNGISQHGVLVFRMTGLDDVRHIAFSRKFGELDNVAPYLVGGRPHRLDYVELFDVGNIELNGSIFPLYDIRSNWNKV